MDNYTKLRIIGTGSFGTVWLTRSKSNLRNYVLKEIPLSMVEERDRTSVLNEVRVLSRLRHKNIIRYKEAFLNNSFLCISMEFAYEGDLFKKIQKQCGRMFLKEQVLDWFIQLCLSLKYIHGMNILHRDIKSQNIFLAKDNVIKLGDFGIARVLQNTLDHAQTVIGTPYYLSPEICQRQPYNHKSDIWALGCVLYEMITLRHPFESSDFPGLVMKILDGGYLPIPEDHGPLLRDLITVLLRVKPCERPSAKQILHIPAMKPYVDEVLARGRTQRSESVSYSSNKQSKNRDQNKWRKPDVIPAEHRDVSQRCCLKEMKDDLSSDMNFKTGKVIEESRKRPRQWKTSEPYNLLEDWFLSNDTDSKNHEVQSRRRRVSSDVFLCDIDCNILSEEAVFCETQCGPENCIDENLKVDKKNQTFTLQTCPIKSRSYSTSIVRETAERQPLMLLNQAVPHLRDTFDVVPGERQLSQQTYTIIESSRSKIPGEIKTNHWVEGKRVEEQKTFQKQQLRTKCAQPVQLNKDKAEDLIKILLTNHHIKFENITLADSLSSYMNTLRSFLKDTLGDDIFIVLYNYLTNDVENDMAAEVNVVEKLFEITGAENVLCISLILQLIQCENSCS